MASAITKLAQRGPAHSSRRRLLVVEDEHIIALDLRNVLEELGYEVVATAASSEEALRAVQLHRPELVLMDVRIKGPVDGIQTAERIRQQDRIPIVFMTANDDGGTLARALETEPAGYLAKPYEERTLQTTIEVALRRGENDQAVEQEHRQERQRAESRTAELTELAERLRKESTIDQLTGLFNRRHFEASIKRELSLAARKQLPVGIILIDLDRFKQINDSLGHPAGDAILRAFSGLIRASLRPYDVPCRYGGEEIVIVVPGTAGAGAQILAERLRVGLEELAIDHCGRRLPQVTASFGVAAFPADGAGWEPLLAAADEALYAAKAAGRNRVVLAATPPTPGE